MTWADSATDAAEAAYVKAHNNYIESVISGKAGTPDEIRKLKEQMVDPAAESLTQALATFPTPPQKTNSQDTHWGIKKEDVPALEKKFKDESDTEIAKGAREAWKNGRPEVFKEKQNQDSNIKRVGLKPNGVQSKGGLLSGPKSDAVNAGSSTVPITSSEPLPENKVEGTEQKTVIEFKARPSPVPEKKRR